VFTRGRLFGALRADYSAACTLLHADAFRVLRDFQASSALFFSSEEERTITRLHRVLRKACVHPAWEGEEGRLAALQQPLFRFPAVPVIPASVSAAPVVDADPIPPTPLAALPVMAASPPATVPIRAHGADATPPAGPGTPVPAMPNAGGGSPSPASLEALANIPDDVRLSAVKTGVRLLGMSTRPGHGRKDHYADTYTAGDVCCVQLPHRRRGHGATPRAIPCLIVCLRGAVRLKVTELFRRV
jgi:hypothetical protein